MKRVVVTGMGAVTPIGNNVEEFWDGIKKNKVGIGEITKFGMYPEYSGSVKNQFWVLKPKKIFKDPNRLYTANAAKCVRRLLPII